MGFLNGLESIKYRFVLDLIKSEEAYNKKCDVISGKEVFKRFYNRYLLMQDILSPLKKKLGDRVEVLDIYFTNCLQDGDGITVKYLKNDKQYLLTFSNYDFEVIDMFSTDITVHNNDFVEDNKKMIINTFRNIDENSLDEEIIVQSTSKRFTIKDNCDSFCLKDSESKIITMEEKYSDYVKNRELYKSMNIDSNYTKLREIFLLDGTLKQFMNHIRFYETDVPKIKKLTNR